MSPFLREGATGHFGTYHEGFFNAFSGRDVLIKYLGAKGDLAFNETRWFEPVVPLTLGRPLPWAGISFIKAIKQIIGEGEQKTHLFVYEGNLIWALVLLLASEKKNNVSATVNLMDTKRYLKPLNTYLGTLFLKKFMLYIQTASNGRVKFSAETEDFQKKVTQDIGIEMLVFPKFSALGYRPTEGIIKSEIKNVLINIRGDDSAKSIVLALQQRSLSIQYFIHGLDTKYDLELEGMKNVFRTSQFQDIQEYRAFLEKMNRVIIHYPPKDFSHQSSGRLIDSIFLKISVCVPSETALATTAKYYGNSSLYSFDDQNSLIKQLQPDLQFSADNSKENPDWDHFVQGMRKLSEPINQIRESTFPKGLIFGRFMLYLYFPYWVTRGFGLNSWKLFFWRLQQKLISKVTKTF